MSTGGGNSTGSIYNHNWYAEPNFNDCDFDHSGSIDIYDLDIFADGWLLTGYAAYTADLARHNNVNSWDYAIWAGYWLAGGCVNLASSCVGHWKMNDNAASQMVIDSSGNGRDGTAQQNTNVLHTTGKIEGALTFNGSSDYINVGSVIGTDAYTKVAWVKRDAGNYYNNIVSSGDVWSHVIYAPYTQSFKLSAGHVDPYNQVQDPNPIDVNVWYFVAVTFDPNVSSGRMVLYKNDVKVSEANNVPTQHASMMTYIGRFVSGYGTKGAIDNVMIFNRALTAEEIATLYNGGSGTEIIPSGGDP